MAQPLSAAPQTATPTTASLGILASFPAASRSSDTALFGSDQALEPPDTQIAAGGSDLVEPVNDTVWVWSKTGTPLVHADLNVFFQVPTGYTFTDPRVAFDPSTGRWFMSGMASDSSNNSFVYLATSATSDPTGNWYVFTVNFEAGVLQDQPKVGFDSNVVVLSWNDFSGISQAFSGQETWVLNKADLLAGGPLVFASIGPDATRDGVVPAISLSPASTEYAVYNGSCGTNTTGLCRAGSSAIGVVSLTGIPPSTVTWTESNPGIVGTISPPPADQPGAAASVATNDDRFLADTFDNGTLYVSGNDGCVPSGDSTERSCARLIEVATATTSVTVDGNLSYVGASVYYPAVVPDANGNVFLAATYSSSAVYPEAVGLAVASGASSVSATAFRSGAGVYSGNRWGDYSGAALDPTDPTHVWLAAEYAPVSGGDWGTAIGELTLATGGAYTALTPTRLLDTRSTGQTLGPGGSLNLTVTGGSVPTNATAVALNVTLTNTSAVSYLSVYPTGGSRPLLSNLNWGAGETVPNLVIVPIGANGQVTFYNNAGNSDVVVDLEGYFAPEVSGSTAGSYVPLTPARITDTRAGSGYPNSGSTLGTGSTLNIQVTGAGGVPATGVTSALMNVTVTDTTAVSFLAAYPQGTALPLASNLNWTPGDTVANRVVVPVGPTGQISVYSPSGSTDVVVDVDGYFTNGTTAPTNESLFTPISPTRVLDTRITHQTLGTGVTLGMKMTGVDGIAAGATAVVTNVTATDTSASSFFTVYPGGTRPLASDVNWAAGGTVPNLTVATLSSGGAMYVYNNIGSVDLIIDAFGYFSPD